MTWRQDLYLTDEELKAYLDMSTIMDGELNDAREAANAATDKTLAALKARGHKCGEWCNEPCYDCPLSGGGGPLNGYLVFIPEGEKE